ncbi:hypothetical protein ACWNYQ_00530 [Candidatus Vidania fulgoroideorum]
MKIYEIVVVFKNYRDKFEEFIKKIKIEFLKKKIKIEFVKHGLIKLKKKIKKNKEALFISIYIKKNLNNLEIIKKNLLYNKLVLRSIILLVKKEDCLKNFIT